MPVSQFARGLHRLADPKISLASFASLYLGATLAARDGPLHWPWLAVTVLGIFAVEVAKNASGELFDYDSGCDMAVREQDRTPFSGGKRVLVDRLLTRSQCRNIAIASYLIAFGSGIAIAGFCEPRILWIAVAGIALAYFYQSPPLRLSYRGLGESAVAVAYVLIVVGTYLAQRHEIHADTIRAGIPLGLLIAAFLLVNEFPDEFADRQSGKRNLVVILSRSRAAALFTAVLLSALLLAVAQASLWMILGAAAAAIPCWRAQAVLRANLTNPNAASLIPAQKSTLLAFVLFAVAAGSSA